MPSTSPFAFLQPTARTIAVPTTPASRLPLRTTVGPWRVMSAQHGLLDRTRYAVLHMTTAQQAVLELFDVPALVLGSYTARMREVIDSVARIDHSGVLKLYDCGTLADGRPYLVREAIDGYTLDELRADAPLSTRTAIRIVRGICEVIAVAHAAGARHGVLDLEHVLVRETDDTIVLLDWRVADVIADEALHCGRVVASWASSVQPDRSAADDVYDIGVILLELIGDSVPPALESLVLAMCDADPRARPGLDVVLARLRIADDEVDRGVRCTDELPRKLRMTRMFAASRWRFSTFAACAAVIAFLAWRADRPRVITARAESLVMTSAPNTPPPRLEPAAFRSEQVTITPPTPTTATPAATTTPRRVMTVKPKPKPAPSKAVPVRFELSPPASNAHLLREYQRVGRGLLELEQQLGAARVADLRAELRAIKITAGMAVAGSHHDVAATLAGLGQRIERLRPIKVSDACRNNALANDCQ